MTSRSLCFRLMKEDLKRRVWTIAWTLLSLFFTMVVPIAMACGDYKERLPYLTRNSDLLRSMQDVASLLYYNYLVVLIMLITAVLWAVSGFHYLHNSRKTDFYHSIPVKRSQLFLAPYLNGILVPFACYLVMEIISMVFVLQAGIGPDLFGAAAWTSMFLNMVYYCLIYTTVVTAVMMTGNTIVSLLATGVFCAYGPAITALYLVFCSTNFDTYFVTYAGNEMFERIMSYSSPFANYMRALVDFAANKTGWSPLSGILVLLVTAALALVAYSLYRLRPSEAAGKAMAFEKTKTPIRILITVPVGIAAGLMFFMITDNKVGWLVFGGICGSLLTHCLMEIIYSFDFRKLFSHRYQMAAVTVAVLVVVLAGYYDLFGYDSWYPDADKVVDASVMEQYGNNWISYGEVEFRENSDGGYYTWKYADGNEYRMAHMKLTDVYPAAELARAGAEMAKKNRFASVTEGNYTRMLMRFKMKNGRTVYRAYRILMDDGNNQANFDAVADSVEYKAGIYPVMAQTASETAEVIFQQYNLLKPVETDEEGRGKLLAAFQKDMEDLKVETMRHEVPIGTIKFVTVKDKVGMDYNQAVGTNGGIEGRCYYPVYPSFTRTLGLLEEAGIQVERMDETNISSISILYYDWLERNNVDQEIFVGDSGDGAAASDSSGAAAQETAESADVAEEKFIEYKDKEDIRALAPGLCYDEYVNMNSFLRWDDLTRSRMNVTVYLTRQGTRWDGSSKYTGTWTEAINCFLDLSKLSPETIEKYYLNEKTD